MGNRIALFCNDKLHTEGTVGIALTGNITLDTIVAQGCRPIGTPHQIGKCDRNIILEIEEQVPLILLRDLIASLNDEEKILAQNSLFVGVAMSEFKQDLQQGDFLIRNILGVDPSAGAIAVGDYLRPGQRLQFHLRDAQTSAQDLEFLLNKYQQEQANKSSPVGALMFSCLGRGEGLYRKPNFDSQLFQQYVKDIPLGGFFCNGEIGPVGESTFVHGFTSVFAICRTRE